MSGTPIARTPSTGFSTAATSACTICVCVTRPHELFGVGRWYDDFSPVSDEEVLALLAEAATPNPNRRP